MAQASWAMVSMALAMLCSAGCLANDPEPRAEGPAPADVPLGATELPQDLDLDGCTGGRSIFDAPAALFPGERPPGWSESSLHVTSIDLELLRCDRLAFGPFVRGPIALAIEHHSNHHTPESCADTEAYTYSQVISFVAVNDTDVATRLATALGLPVLAMDIGIQQAPAPTPGTWVETWRMSPAAGDSLEVNLPHHGQGGARGRLVERLFWWNATHLGYTDLGLGYETDAGGPTWGTMAPPSLVAKGGPQTYAGTGGTVDALAVDAPLRLFRGFDCDEAARVVRQPA